MGAEASYGTQADVIAVLLRSVGDAAVVLAYDEDRTFAALSLNRFGSVGSCRLDWHGAEVLHRSPAFDGGELRRLLGSLASPDELAVLFWGNLAVPSLASEAGLLATHADAVLECCPECWVYLVDSGVLIEFQDGEGFTAGRVPR
ncbi:hypothetical protein ACIRG4_24415 [Streptomyces sp. NPDC102395]|uniref:hypothetical protein n=1 Tax=Streptomyces sp. NPDC102395 TaxID=3366168 RepID=UPI00380D8C00